MKNSIEAWSLKNWLKLDPSLRQKCIEHLREKLPAEDVAAWKANHARGHRLDDGMQYFHFGYGMGIRNLLREVVKDKELPVVTYGDRTESQNWDDYYLGTLIELVESDTIVNVAE